MDTEGSCAIGIGFWTASSASLSEEVAIEPAAITYNIEEGKGSLRVSDKIAATMQPYTDLGGRVTTLHDSVFSTIPGSPAFVSKAEQNRVSIPEHGFAWEFNGRNAIQGAFHFEA